MNINGNSRTVWLAFAAALLACGALGALGACDSCERKRPETTPGVTGNAITKNAITKNAIEFAVITGNPVSTSGERRADVLGAPLVGGPGARGSGTVADRLGDRLADPLTQIFMQYVVECALPEGQDVAFPAGAGHAAGTWKGQIGLCPGWATSGIADDDQCQELISSCLLARNNAFGEPVELSLRGWGVDDLTYFGEPPETVAFPYEEGAFYGNIFRSATPFTVDAADGRLVYTRADTGDRFEQPMPQEKATRVRMHYAAIDALFPGAAQQQPVVVYDQMFACASPGWTLAEMYARLRVCAAPNEFSAELCAARPLGVCGGATRICALQHEPDSAGAVPALPHGYWDYDDCTDDVTRRAWRRPLTTFLEDSCDAVRDLGERLSHLPEEIRAAVKEARELCARQPEFDRARARAIRGVVAGGQGMSAQGFQARDPASTGSE